MRKTNNFKQAKRINSHFVLQTLNRRKKNIFCWLWTSEKNSHFANFKKIICQNLVLEKLGELWDAMPRHWSVCFLVSPCYLQNAMLYQWSSSDLRRLLRIWESVFYSRAFFTLYSFMLFSRLPWGWQFNLKVSRASRWSEHMKHNPDRVFVWITAIHNKSKPVGSI